MVNFFQKLKITFLIFSFCGAMLAQIHSVSDGDFFKDARVRQNFRLPVTEKEVESLAESARVIAQRLLARNPKDKKGLMLLKFAHHLNPDSRDVQLLRGKIKFDVKINTPSEKISVENFLDELIKVSAYNYRTDNALGRHFKAVLCQMIRLFEPGNEDAIVTLINFEDKGFNTDLNDLLSQKLSSTLDIEYDPKDPRYVISDIKKTVFIPANQPWTDTWVKVKEGKIVRVRTQQLWSMGRGGSSKLKLKIPACGGEGLADTDIETLLNPPSPTKKKKKPVAPGTFQKSSLKANPGCLLARIGKKEYAVGSEAVFRAESAGILFFGPFEWDDYSDNIGSLKVTFQVSDK